MRAHGSYTDISLPCCLIRLARVLCRRVGRCVLFSTFPRPLLFRQTTNVTLDNCQGVGVVLADCIASVDVVNCKKVQVQVTGQTPTVSFDKTSGAMLFITRAAKDSTTIVTSMSTEINVTLPGATENDDAVRRCARSARPPASRSRPLCPHARSHPHRPRFRLPSSLCPTSRATRS